MDNNEKKVENQKIDRESRFSGIVDPMKDELADQHQVPGQGDPSIRRRAPDQGSLTVPPVSEQQLDEPKKVLEESQPGSGASGEEHPVLHTPGGEMPDVDRIEQRRKDKEQAA